ncbi:MAG: pyrimidine utilization protein A [Rhodospirillales bacterium 20-64-7]|nr:MAG: pyrimidine utilization protein A [Rhodospirillales bacterium 20-64-7]HQT77778.1 pyrimidine utilization protein A [Rhodopila sp.]
MEVGVFIPIGNNGWLISKTAPQYKPSFDLNREIVQRAEHYGLDFALSMIKLRGFGGDTEFWDYNLESFTLMAGLAAVTTRIKLFASVAVLTIPPAIVARMAVTIDSISHGRFGINIVSGWQSAEYTQMGVWPGDQFFSERYEYSTEYVQVLQQLWQEGRSDFQGRYFKMDDCRLLPQPSQEIEIVCAGQSDRGMRFTAEYGNYAFCLGTGINTPTAHAPTNARLAEAGAKAGRDVGTYVLMMVIADETDEAAMAKWTRYQDGADIKALTWLSDQAGADASAAEHSTARSMVVPDGAINFNMGTLVGSYATVARMLDEAASVPGTRGIMLTFDDFLVGIEQFGQHIQPLMQSRKVTSVAA